MQQHPIARQHCYLETNRLILRPLTHADAPSIQTAASVRAVADGTISIPHCYPNGEAERLQTPASIRSKTCCIT